MHPSTLPPLNPYHPPVVCILPFLFPHPQNPTHFCDPIPGYESTRRLSNYQKCILPLSPPQILTTLQKCTSYHSSPLLPFRVPTYYYKRGRYTCLPTSSLPCLNSLTSIFHFPPTKDLIHPSLSRATYTVGPFSAAIRLQTIHGSPRLRSARNLRRIALGIWFLNSACLREK